MKLSLKELYIHVTVRRNRFLFKITNQTTNYPNLFCNKTLHVSGTSFADHQEFSTVHSAVVSFMQVLITASKQSQDAVPNVQWKTPDDGQRRFPKHVEFYNRINLDN